MLPRSFLTIFWLMFIGLLGMLGVAVAMLAGAMLRTGEVPMGITATFLAFACGLLCGIAQDALRALGPARP